MAIAIIDSGSFNGSGQSKLKISGDMVLLRRRLLIRKREERERRKKRRSKDRS